MIVSVYGPHALRFVSFVSRNAFHRACKMSSAPASDTASIPSPSPKSSSPA
jgi:hypothetical protein